MAGKVTGILTPPNNALKLTAHGRGLVGRGAPQLNAVLGRQQKVWRDVRLR